MSAVYEDPTILSEYLLFHYGSREEILPLDVTWPGGMVDALDFAVRTPRHFTAGDEERGLDLGCAVGRSTYEMSRRCAHVTGIDYSHAFIGAANSLKLGGPVRYQRRDEGHSATELTAKMPNGVDASKVRFLQGDAMRLPTDLGVFDRIHAANLICRLSDPVLLLERLPGLLATGGELVLATPCTWLEGFTPSDKWPSADTLEWLKGHLGRSFDLTSCCDEPFLIRETARKFQWTRSMVTVWRRR